MMSINRRVNLFHSIDSSSIVDSWVEDLAPMRTNNQFFNRRSRPPSEKWKFHILFAMVWLRLFKVYHIRLLLIGWHVDIKLPGVVFK